MAEKPTEREMLEAIAQAEQGRIERARAMLQQFRAILRQQTGVDIQPFVTLGIGGTTLDFQFVRVPGWQPPDNAPKPPVQESEEDETKWKEQ